MQNATYAKIINKRLPTICDALLFEEQCRFKNERWCNDNVFTIIQMIEKWRGFNCKTHLVFIDLKKVFDQVDTRLG